MFQLFSKKLSFPEILHKYYINNDDKQYEYISNLIDNYESNDYADDIEKKQILELDK